MDAGLKAKWVAALRSGEYVQCKHYFDHNGKHCALGVLYCVTKGRTFDAMRDGLRDTVIRMNDNRGKSFAEIADYIEREVV